MPKGVSQGKAAMVDMHIARFLKHGFFVVLLPDNLGSHHFTPGQIHLHIMVWVNIEVGKWLAVPLHWTQVYDNIKVEFKVKPFTEITIWSDRMSKYTIKDAAKLMNVPTSTIRYYDKEGLLPFMGRLESGYRVFSESDLAMMKTIDCLKKTGMPIKDIRQFIEWVQAGDASLSQRYGLFLERKKAVEEQIAELQNTLDIVNFKCWYYRTALEQGNEEAVKALAEKAMRDPEQSNTLKKAIHAAVKSQGEHGTHNQK
jgi:DNA-binding transcriptional MerR regulator